MDRMQNHTPATFATSQIAGQKRQRNRDPISCQPCRNRKVACDREEPCGSCVKHTMVDKCLYRKPDLPSPDSEPQKPSTTTNRPSGQRNGRDTNVESRLERVEKAVDTLVTLVESRNYGQTSSLQPQAPADRDPWSCPFQDYNRQPDQAKAENPYAQGSLSAKSSELIYWVGPGGWTTQRLDIFMLWDSKNQFARQWGAFADLGKLFVAPKHTTLLQLYIPVSTPSTMDQDLLSLVPNQRICDVLVKRFVATFNTTHPIIDPVLFKMDMARFWEDQDSVSKPFLLCFLAILALGYQLPVLPLESGKSIANGQQQGKDLMTIVQNCLFSSSDLGARPTLPVLQALLCVCLSYKLRIDWVDGNDTISGVLGIAARMSSTMGLHRNPYLSHGIRTDYAMYNNHAFLRRRLFLTLNLIDIEHSVEAGMPYHLRTSDYDEIDGPEAELLSSYERRLASAIPAWSKYLASIISSRSSPPKHTWNEPLLEIAAEHEIEATDTGGRSDKHNLMGKSLQRALICSLHHRILIALNSGTLFHGPQQAGSKTEASLVASAKAILFQQKILYDSVSQYDAPSRSAWHQFFAAISRCTTAYACSTILLVLRRTISDDPLQRSPLPPNEAVPELLNAVQQSLDFATNGLSFSIELIKETMAWAAYNSAIADRLSICAQRGWTSFSMASPEAKDVMHGMQEAMDDILRKARTAIDEARRSDDPNPALLKRTEDEIAADQDGSQPATTNTVGIDPSLLEGEALVAWTKETDALLRDLDLQWPYPLPMGDGSDWIF